MGFHHVYDNADINESKWMIEEIQEHLRSITTHARQSTIRNRLRAQRRRHQEENVSDDESVDSGYSDSDEESDEESNQQKEPAVREGADTHDSKYVQTGANSSIINIKGDAHFN